ncbi:MAG: type IV pilus modification protein PilV [Deltaproteobacteria bacterium]|nr:type IV pilus modification protein PilV [Deltaproteobacteria bacterium]
MTNLPQIKQNAGFTLIEVLVALVILSVGLLGVASMQLNGLRGNHTAYLRSQGLQYAYEVLDMMRANRANAISATASNNYVIAAGEDPATLGKTGVTLSDLNEWLAGLGGTTNVNSGLPGGQGAISVTAIDENADSNPDTWLVRITVSWVSNNADDATPAVVVESKL